MSESDEGGASKTQEQSAAPEAPRLVSTADFDAVDIEAPILGSAKVHCRELESLFWSKREASAPGSPEHNVYGILASACGIHLTVDDKAQPFGPKWVMDGRRSLIPSDWQGEQNAILADLLERLKHPGLRARLADIVWTNDRRKGAAAQVAVDAYCEAAEGLRSGLYEDQFAETRADISREEVDLISRAVKIAHNAKKRTNPLPNRVIANLAEMYDQALSHRDLDSFQRIAYLRFRHSLVPDAKLAADLEHLALSSTDNDYPLAVKKLWDLAAAAYDNAGNKDEHRRCILAGIDQTLRMGEQLSPGLAQAHWIRTAIAELRPIEGTADRREELRLQMRALQEKVLDEMGTFTVPIDFSEEIDRVVEIFDRFTLSEALRRFALIQAPRAVEDLRKKALDSLQEDGLAQMFGATHHDEDGKIVAEVEAAPIDGVPSENWLKSKISKNEEFNRFYYVNAAINPARTVISSNFSISQTHFDIICENSPFIPPTHSDIMALGFARLIQGDYISASYLLIPQLENCVRYVLKNSNVDSSKIMQDMLQEDRTLSALIEKYTAQMDKAFSPYYVLQMDLIFNIRPGPALRHEMAHGKVGAGFCYHPDAIYACWFILHLAVVPLLRYWDTHLAPAIEAASF